LEDNKAEWDDALARLDKNEDGELSFDEAITNAKERRRRRLARRLAGPDALDRFICNDSLDPEAYLDPDHFMELNDDCQNVVVKSIDSECRNFIKTEKLEDETLLHMLAYAMEDSYCAQAIVDELEYGRYSCPYMRVGMDDWIERGDEFEDYPADGPTVDVFLQCNYIIAGAPADWQLVMIREALERFFGDTVLDTYVDIVEQCSSILREATDGRNALQWKTYNIMQGDHAGKKILAYMGTNMRTDTWGAKGNAEQLIADVWSVPQANHMMINMANEAAEVAERVGADFITGHSLGGIITEMVCSKTGIPGASFAALGAFDPFSKRDELSVAVEQNGLYGSAILRAIEEIAEIFSDFGYDTEDVQSFVDSFTDEDLKRRLVETEYNGLILDTLHDGVKFEVVLNTFDKLARPLSSVDGSACSHIARSDDVRWLWFRGGTGHSVQYYTYDTITAYTHGWVEEEEKQGSLDNLWLPGVQRNDVCDYCVDDRYCDSGLCDTTYDRCLLEDGKKVTVCPSGTTNAGEHWRCRRDDECVSGKCRRSRGLRLRKWCTN